MPSVDRRRFLQLSGGAAALAMLPQSIARAASIPAHREKGTIEDVEHIVILMQENRSFDHYFGTMRGVRGFGDPHPATLPSGRSVFHQSDGTKDVLPFRPDHANLGLTFIEDLAHDWDTTHAMFDGGRYDQWVPSKGTTTMAHLERQDIPFHYALADAFTVCDDYHCGMLGPTDPNRYYMWTGWDGNDGKLGGPVIDNAEAGYQWHTYPERLQDAGVSWKIYQDAGLGLDKAGVWGYTDDPYIGNYGDNSLLYFDQYRNAEPGSPLYERARTGTNVSKGGTFFDQLRSDVVGKKLPQVSWVVAPEAFTEHPNWPANYGAWYVSKVLDALTADKDAWSKTALFITYDENDGFFDHVVPAYPNGTDAPGASTVDTTYEHYTGTNGTPGHYGMGVRVPMLVVSPWSTGGWVCSETFDHTSLIRFIEARHGVSEPNVTPWRRTVAGDLTAAFDFDRPKNRALLLPSTAGYEPTDDQRHPDYVPTPPADPALPRQEHGTRPARALGYRLEVTPAVTADALSLEIANHGRLGAALQARPAGAAAVPSTYTVGRGHRLTADLPAAGPYDVSLHGPDGFFRRFAGSTQRRSVEVTMRESGSGRGQLVVHNGYSGRIRATVHDAHTARRREIEVPAHGERSLVINGERTGGWYDLTVTVEGNQAFLRHLAGHLASSEHGTSDPLIGR